MWKRRKCESGETETERVWSSSIFTQTSGKDHNDDNDDNDDNGDNDHDYNDYSDVDDNDDDNVDVDGDDDDEVFNLPTVAARFI